MKVLQRADLAETQRFVEEAYAPKFLAAAPMGVHVTALAGASPLAQPYDGLTSRRVTPTSAAVVFRSVTLDDWFGVVVEVEPQPPFRIVSLGAGLMARAPEGVRRPEPFKVDRDAWRALNTYTSAAARVDLFSGVVAVARGPLVVGTQGYGEASKEFGVPNTPSTRMLVGSINKMFTAVGILQLVEQGRLSLDDPVAAHLPGILTAEVEGVVRIKHLLTHTSGLGNVLFTADMQQRNRADFRYLADYLPLLKDQKLAFAPGTRWRYSNANFLVLGAILEKVSGLPYDDYLAARVFGPAGMTESGPLELDRVPKGIAFGYERDFNRAVPGWKSDRYAQVVRGTPAGGGYSTAADLVRFVHALRTHRLLSPASTEAMLTPKPELNSPAYGYGTEIFDPGLVGHTGGGPGTGAHVQFNVAGDLTVVVLGNIATEPGIIIRRAFAIFPERAGTAAANAALKGR